MVFKAVNPYSGAYVQKQAFRLDETTIFGVCENFNLTCLIPVLVTATLRVLPRTFADLDCLRYNASTTWTHGKFQRTYNSVAWRMSGKFQRTYRGKFQRTYREACPSSASSHERYYMPHPTPPAHTCTYRQPQRSMSFLRKFTWTLLHAPPHPTRAYMHLPAATDKHVLPPQVHMNGITCPTPPHPTPPMCTKHHGLLKAVVQLKTWKKQ